MLKAYKYRILPNKEQSMLINKHFGCSRFLYNYFLNYRQKEYEKGNKVDYIQTQSELTKLKKLEEYKWLNECASQCLQMSLRALDNGFSRFFKKHGSYPRFKSKKNYYQSFTSPQNIKIEDNRVKLPKFMKHGIKIILHREIPEGSTLKQATISRNNDKYYIAIQFDDNKPVPKPVKTKNAVGLDMGLDCFSATSEGLKYENQRYYIKTQKKLKHLQRKLSKKKKGSVNRIKAKLKVQRLHTKTANQRKDYLHKISNEITNQFDIICTETLNTKGLMKNRCLAKSIADVSWGEFINQIEYKSMWKGKTLIKIDRWFPSSQLCSICGKNTGQKPLHVRNFTCPYCGTEHDRDINASVNIRNYGLGQINNKNTAGTVEIQACGASSSGALSNGNASYDVMKQEALNGL